MRSRRAAEPHWAPSSTDQITIDYESNNGSCESDWMVMMLLLIMTTDIIATIMIIISYETFGPQVNNLHKIFSFI